MTLLYLIRHGQSAWSLSGRYTSVTEVDLTDIGCAQAQSLRCRLNPEDFGLQLTSPRSRALQTASLAGFTPEVDEDLAEWYYGDFEGKTLEEIRQEIPDWQIWNHPVPGGEQAYEVLARCARIVEKVRSCGVDKAICFAHGHILRVIALCWIGLDISHGGSLPIATATVNVLGYEDEEGVPAIKTWNA